MKNKLELHLAAQATAQKVRESKTVFLSAQIVLSDFAELKIDDKHYESFALQVNEIVYQFNALEKQPLEMAAPPATA